MKQKLLFSIKKRISRVNNSCILAFLLMFIAVGQLKADIKPAKDTPRHTYQFYVIGLENTATLYREQILLSGETLLPPPMPVNLSPGAVFTGWHDAEADFDDPPVEFSGPVKITEDKTIKLLARFTNRVYVQFKVESALSVKGQEASSLRVVATEELDKDATVKTDSIPIIYPSGKIFSHWSKEVGGNPFDLKSEIKENTSLYLVYKEGYRVSFRMRGGKGVLPKYYTKGNQLDPDEKIKPIRSGYTFKGWCTINPNTLSPGQNYDDLNPNFYPKQNVTGDLVLRALWTKNKNTPYNVVYWFQNADAKDDDYSVRFTEAYEGETESEPQYRDISFHPDLAGFELDYDKTNSSRPKIDGFGSTVKNVYYKRKKYTLTFIRKVGGYNDYGNYVTEKIPIREYKDLKFGQRLDDQWNEVSKMPGNERTLWYVNEILSSKPKAEAGDEHYTNVPTMPSRNLVVYALDIQGALSIAKLLYLDKQTNERIIPDYSYLVQDDAIPLITKSDGIKIKGFSFNMNDFRYDETHNEMVKEYVWFNGVKTGVLFYDRESYRIKFNTLLGTTLDSELIPYQKDISDYEVITINDIPFIKGKVTNGDGKVFQGWFTSEFAIEGTEFVFKGKKMPAEDLLLYAKWEDPAHQVRLHTGSEKNSLVYDSLTFAHNSFISPDVANAMATSLPKGNVSFYRWFWYKDGQFARYDMSEPIITDVDLYPVWNEDAFMLEYNLNNGGAGGVLVDANAYIPATLALVKNIPPQAAPEGKVFIGWKSNIENDEKLYAPGDVVSVIQNPVILTAQWEELPKKTSITYNSNEGVGDDIVVSDLNNNAEHTAIVNEKFTRQGFEFSHWSTSPNTGGVEYKAGDKLIVSQPTSPTSNILYAQWKNTTFVRNLNLNSKLRFYPNPVVDRLYIDTEKQIQSVEVLNLTGRRVLFVESFGADNALKVLDMSQLEAGAYIVRLVMKDGFDILKVLKQ